MYCDCENKCKDYHRWIDFTETPVFELYGSNCFSNAVMRERLPKNIYQEVVAIQEGEKELTLEVAEVVATSMR